MEKNKSGYGDSTNVNVNYDNALGSDYQYSYKYDKSNKLTFSISDKMKVSGDTADLWSEDPSTHGTSGSNVWTMQFLRGMYQEAVIIHSLKLSVPASLFGT